MALTDTFIEKQITLDLSQAGLGFSIIGGTDEPLEDGKGQTLLPKVNQLETPCAGLTHSPLRSINGEHAPLIVGCLGSTAIAVSNVLARGAAYGAGLQVQDRIVSVDGISFRGVSHNFAVEAIKNAIPNRV